jgi:predicted esterase
MRFWYGLSLAALATAGVASPVPAQSLTAIADFSETVDGVFIAWEKAVYEDLSIAGTSTRTIPLGLSWPAGYAPGGGPVYPLVLYLHGAGARGNDNKALMRETARFFARSARTHPTLCNAFVLVPQCPTNARWVETDWGDGPYDQNNVPGNNYSEYMHLTEKLLDYLTDPAHDATLAGVLGIRAGDIDESRLYVVGDSMGAYGTWDLIARHPGRFAAAIAAAGSGPRNRLPELRQTPIWAIHGALDTTVPNALPDATDPDGAGSLGMLGMLDPAFSGLQSTPLVYVDNPSQSGDDPEPATSLIYSEFPTCDHNPPASGWTGITSGTREWIFAQSNGSSTCPRMAADTLQGACGSCGDCSCGTCGDGRIQMCEMIGYACAWKDGCNDDLAGMTRAAFIWKAGECYCWDSSEQTWMPTTCPAPPSGCCGP